MSHSAQPRYVQVPETEEAGVVEVSTSPYQALDGPVNYSGDATPLTYDSEDPDVPTIGIIGSPSTVEKAKEAEEYEIARKEHPPVRWIIFVTTSTFMGYAILVSFQHKLKVAYNIKDDGSERSKQWSVAVSFLYIFNLIFRLAHNFIFFFIIPRRRVYVSMGAMCLSMFILGIGVFEIGTTNIAWIYIAYALGGVSIGSFESNVLSAITPLGHDTKVWAIIGFPLGFASILIGGFALTAMGAPTVTVYLIVFAFLIVGMLMFRFWIPHIEIAHNATTVRDFFSNLMEFKLWGPKLLYHCPALTVDMFMVSLFSGLMLYLFNDPKHVPLFGPHSETLVPVDPYFVFYNLFTLAGDSLSRRLIYSLKNLHHPFWFLIFSFGGAAICLSKYAIIAPIGIFFVMFANGCIYATTTRHIDQHVEKRFNLIALSFWLFIGDVGSVIGSNVLPYIDDWICGGHYEYMCTKS